MPNTKIQIKRSTVTAAPTTLDIGELAYSYSSNTLYIGNTAGSGVLAIGGTSVGASSNGYANTVGAAANAYANLVGTSGNAYANVVGTSGNNWATATFVKLTSGTLQTISSDITLSGNLTVSGTTTYANSQTLLIGDNIITLNADIPSTVAPAENAGIEVNRGNKNSNAALTFIEATGAWAFTSNTLNSYTTYIASNTFVESVALSANGYATTVGASGNAYANVVGNAANTYAALVGSIANTNAANGSYISAGVVKVPFGGTGLTTFTQNGIVFGNTAGDLKVTAAGTEGQVLQASSTGVPQFGMLDGGVF